MITKYDVVSRDGWPAGPWDDEPDFFSWESDAGFKCEIVRHDLSGHLCGYVLIPKGHAWHGNDMKDFDVDVHGGITYAHTESGKGWKIGFDCDLLGDMPPRPITVFTFGVYRSAVYARAQCESLAAQARDAAALRPSPRV